MLAGVCLSRPSTTSQRHNDAQADTSSICRLSPLHTDRQPHPTVGTIGHNWGTVSTLQNHTDTAGNSNLASSTQQKDTHSSHRYTHAAHTTGDTTKQSLSTVHTVQNRTNMANKCNLLGRSHRWQTHTLHRDRHKPILLVVQLQTAQAHCSTEPSTYSHLAATLAAPFLATQ